VKGLLSGAAVDSARTMAMAPLKETAKGSLRGAGLVPLRGIRWGFTTEAVLVLFLVCVFLFNVIFQGSVQKGTRKNSPLGPKSNCCFGKVLRVLAGDVISVEVSSCPSATGTSNYAQRLHD
jgi:hypothetical protein